MDPHLELSTGNFRRIAELIRNRAGIELAESKRQLVHSRLSRRLRSRALNTFDEYLALLDGGDSFELQEFTNALTTNLTAFFREPHHFEALAKDLLARRAGAPAAKVIKIWCAASSTGEEPYSIAMTAAETFGCMNPPVRIVASDIDTAVLEHAKRGVYSTEQLAAVSPSRRNQFFVAHDATHAQVRAEVRNLVTFRQFNLLVSNPPVDSPLDIIFCRNVLIYFNKDTQREILQRFARLLRPDGLLITGHAETLFRATDLFESRGNTVHCLRARSAQHLDSSPNPLGTAAVEVTAGRATALSAKVSVERDAQQLREALIFVGSSTGGPEALKQLLSALPAQCPPILITQHIPAGHVAALVQRLNAAGRVKVNEGTHGTVVQRGNAYIAPGHAHMRVRRVGSRFVIELDPAPPVSRHRPSVDVLFHSAAQITGTRTIGIILTGMGADGAEGLLAMKRAGSYTYAQDQASCVVFGMPRQAIALGAADEVLPISAIPPRLIQRLSKK